MPEINDQNILAKVIEKSSLINTTYFMRNINGNRLYTEINKKLKEIEINFEKKWEIASLIDYLAFLENKKNLHKVNMDYESVRNLHFHFTFEFLK